MNAPLPQPRRAHVTGWGRYVPSQVLTNHDLERMVDHSTRTSFCLLTTHVECAPCSHADSRHLEARDAQ